MPPKIRSSARLAAKPVAPVPEPEIRADGEPNLPREQVEQQSRLLCLRKSKRSSLLLKRKLTPNCDSRGDFGKYLRSLAAFRHQQSLNAAIQDRLCKRATRRPQAHLPEIPCSFYANLVQRMVTLAI